MFIPKLFVNANVYPEILVSFIDVVKGIIRVSKLQGIDLFYYLLDLRELANSVVWTLLTYWFTGNV